MATPAKPSVDRLDPAVDRIGRFGPIFLQNVSYIYVCDEAAKFVWCGLEGFYHTKTAGKVDLLLSTLSGMNELAPPLLSPQYEIFGFK